MGFAYLAAPYSHSDPEVVAERMLTYCKVDARLIKQGHHTISPLSKHFILQYEQLPGDWKFWQSYGTELLALCDRMFVICIAGWRESTGVQDEIKMARDRGLPIYYLNELGEEIGMLE